LISHKSILELTSIPLRYNFHEEKILFDNGWFEDDRSEEVHSSKCHDGDYPLTKGLRENNKAHIATYIVPVHINRTTIFEKVRFHDKSIVELLGCNHGYARYTVHTKRGKAYKIIIKSPVYPDIITCEKSSEIKKQSKDFSDKIRITVLKIIYNHGIETRRQERYFYDIKEAKMFVEKYNSIYNKCKRKPEIYGIAKIITIGSRNVNTCLESQNKLTPEISQIDENKKN